jgi:4-carboxymuconolactone decarboxylase
MHELPPRILPLPESEWSNEQRELLQPALSGKGLGRGVLNIFGTLIRHPKLYKRWSIFGTHLLFKSTLAARDRELVILRMAWLCGSDYEWGQHLSIGRAAGITDLELDRIPSGPRAQGWGEEDATLLQAVDELKDATVIGAATWARLAARFSERQIMDLIFTAGQYCMLAMALNSMGVQLDKEIAAAEAAHQSSR